VYFLKVREMAKLSAREALFDGPTIHNELNNNDSSDRLRSGREGAGKNVVDTIVKHGLKTMPHCY
jgi:hypothetical protein